MCHIIWRAQKSKKTGTLRKMHLRIQVRAHMSASTRKIHPGEGHLGSADPRISQTWTSICPGASWRGVAPKQPHPGEIRFSCKGSRGVAPTPPVPLYKGASSPFSHEYPSISFVTLVKGKSREAPTCILSLGSV